MSRRHLLLHYFPKSMFGNELRDIAGRVSRLEPAIIATVLSTKWPHPVAALRAALNPTVSVEFQRARHFFLLRGAPMRQWPHLDKVRELAHFEAAGLPVPKWRAITPGTMLDPAEWGPYVVVKPATGGRGAYVRINRTARVRYRPPEALAEDDPGRQGGQIAQAFVYTGRWPVSYRVLTLFGAPLYALQQTGATELEPLVHRTDFRRRGGVSIVATSRRGHIKLSFDEEIIDLARRVHATMPTVPVLGQDIVRDIDTGQLYILETNPAGQTWALGSRAGVRMRAAIEGDLYTQFGALDRSAEALVDHVRRYAR